jgi:2-phospho-L-lactate guanylyltransferase (CobY/MobA/RfbA family)
VTQVWGATQLTVVAGAAGWAAGRVLDPGLRGNMGFGDNSFFPHLAAAKAHGIEPRVVRLPRIALDIDTPQDLTQFLLTPSQTRSRALLDRWGVRVACQERATA